MAHATLEEPQECVSALHLAATVEASRTLDTAPATPLTSGAAPRPRAGVVETAGGPANVPEQPCQVYISKPLNYVRMYVLAASD